MPSHFHLKSALWHRLSAQVRQQVQRSKVPWSQQCTVSEVILPRFLFTSHMACPLATALMDSSSCGLTSWTIVTNVDWFYWTCFWRTEKHATVSTGLMELGITFCNFGLHLSALTHGQTILPHSEPCWKLQGSDLSDFQPENYYS